MSDFVNTIDLLGDDVVVKQIIDGVITEFKDDVVTYVRSEGFIDCMNLTVVDLPNLTRSDLRSFGRCTNLRTVNLPKLSNIGMYLFDENKAIEKLVFPSVTSSSEGGLRGVGGLRIVDFHVKIGIPNRMFNDDSKLTCLILRSETQCDLLNAAAFTNTPITSGTGYIYVPRALVDSYKTATNWSTFANQFRALEDYTVDGTVTGELDSLARILIKGILSGKYINNRVTKIRPYAFGQRTDLTTVECKNVTSVGDKAFVFRKVDIKETKLAKVVLPSAHTIGVNVFGNCTSLVSVDLSSVESIGSQAFEGCSKIELIDLPKVKTIKGYSVFGSCTKLTSLILRNSGQTCTVETSQELTNTPIASGTGYIYVPRALIDSYKTATNWSVYANQFRAIEDYPEICGGEL